MWTIVTFLRPWRSAYSNANRTMRRDLGARVDAGRDGDRLRVVADRDVVLEADVESLEVLADEHEVDVLVAPARASWSGRAQVGVEAELLPQADVDRAVAAADRRRQRALERQLGAADAVEQGRRAADRRLP